MTDYLNMAGKPTPIPVVRDAMTALANDLRRGHTCASVAAVMLDRMVNQLKRKPPISVAPKRIRPLSDGQKAAVRAEHRARPHLSQLELASIFNTNPGRISEALNEGRA